MSAGEWSPQDAVEPAVPAGATLSGWLARLDAWLSPWGERLNPILVKEVRQALKSWQFGVTFALVLLAAWGWSAIAVSLSAYEMSHREQGGVFFIGYWTILAFPLLIVIPYATFRSLAGEREDRTFELLAITTLSPRQIVWGKLACATVQILVYTSAVAPCLAFSYLLRGIDILTIGLFLVGAMAASLILSLVGVLAATISRERHWQTALSVLLTVGLVMAFFGGIAFTIEQIEWQFIDFQEPDFWIGLLAVITAYAAYFAMAFQAAVALLTFASDNRSTGLRVTMLVQQALFAAWMAWVWAFPMRYFWGAPLVFAAFSAGHWFVMGAMMTGESPNLSQRVRRSLPRSLLGRMLFTWFNPGPATGFMLAVGSLAAVLLLAFLAVSLIPEAANGRFFLGGGAAGQSSALAIIAKLEILLLAYVVAYLGTGKLILDVVRRRARVGPFAAFLLHVLLVAAGSFGPLILDLMANQRPSLSPLHVTSPIAAAVAVFERASPGSTSLANTALVLAPLTACVVFSLNLPGIIREVRFVRVEAPARVREEDAAAYAERFPEPPPSRKNPWE